MVNPPKQRGTAAETIVSRYLTAAGTPTYRRAPTGNHDQGDLWAHGGRGVIEVKSRRTSHTPADIERWLTELDNETTHAMLAGAIVEVSLLVVKRPGSGTRNAGDWFVYMRPGDAAYLLTGASIVDGLGWVQMPLWLVAGRLAEVVLR